MPSVSWFSEEGAEQGTNEAGLRILSGGGVNGSWSQRGQHFPEKAEGLAGGQLTRRGSSF